MQKLKFQFKEPPAKSARFNKCLVAMVKRIFPFAANSWNNQTPTTKRIVLNRQYDFQQWAASFVHSRYRRWLKRGVAHYLTAAQDSIVPPALEQLGSYATFEKCYNCPPSLCCYKFYHPNSVPKDERSRPVRCGRSFCPHCHMRKALTRAKRIMKAVRAVSSYYRNINLFRYEVAHNGDATPQSLREMARQFVAAAKKHKSYLGILWYIHPRINRASDTVTWSLRLLVVGGGSFDVPSDQVAPEFKLVKILPARTLHIFQQVGKVLSWGKWPFWYSNKATPKAWTIDVGRRLTGYGCLHSNSSPSDHAIFNLFKKNNHKKNRGKFLPFDWQALASR